MQNDNQHIPNTNPNSSPPSTTPPSMTRGQRVIQPSPGLAEELQIQRQQEAASQPAPPTTSPQTHPTYGLGSPVDSSKIYPDVTPNIASASTSNPNLGEAKPVDKQRVASRVPALQVYAFLIIIYGLYSVFAFSSIFSMTRTIGGPTGGTAGVYTPLSPILMMVFAVAAINIAVGIYFLIAKNIRAVNSLLTALLIIGGLGLLNSLVSTAQYISHIRASSVVSLLISAGLLMYLWNVKSQVDLASVD